MFFERAITVFVESVQKTMKKCLRWKHIGEIDSVSFLGGYDMVILTHTEYTRLKHMKRRQGKALVKMIKKFT